MSPLDTVRLDRAFELAELSIGVSDPNPRVGCVIGFEDGQVLGEGWTQPAGQAHAESRALAAARERDADVRGATAWVTLEPCSHFGRTPPCCDALINSGVARVVVASLDPNPAVHGNGLRRLRAAGIQVDLATQDYADRSRELNIGFFMRMTRGRCWVRLKVACSLDGRVALPNGSSQWITGLEARTDGHRWRKRAGAIVSGIGTVLADNPRLDVRLVNTHLQPLRVVLDSAGRLPVSAAVLQAPGRVLQVTRTGAPSTEDQRDTPPNDAMPAMRERLEVAQTFAGLDLRSVLSELAARQVNEIHVEAGPRLNGALLDAGLVDELLIYQAPLLVGPGLPFADLPMPTTLDKAHRFRVVSHGTVGSDIRLLARLE